MERVLLRIARRLQRLLRPHQPESGNGLGAMDIGYVESIQSLRTAVLDVPRQRACSAFTEGFSLHAGIWFASMACSDRIRAGERRSCRGRRPPRVGALPREPGAGQWEPVAPGTSPYCLLAEAAQREPRTRRSRSLRISPRHPCDFRPGSCTETQEGRTKSVSSSGARSEKAAGPFVSGLRLGAWSAATPVMGEAEVILMAQPATDHRR